MREDIAFPAGPKIGATNWGDMRESRLSRGPRARGLSVRRISLRVVE
jgi:hypothetical protein